MERIQLILLYVGEMTQIYPVDFCPNGGSEVDHLSRGTKKIFEAIRWVDECATINDFELLQGLPVDFGPVRLKDSLAVTPETKQMEHIPYTSHIRNSHRRRLREEGNKRGSS